MNQYQNILVAIDFSDEGVHVARKAQTLARMFQASLHVIHVLDNIPMPGIPYGTVISLTEATADALLEAEKNKLIQICEQLDIAPDRRWMVWGETQQEITELATAQHIDLIIVGSHGRHGLGVLVGSTAKGILYHAQCDVLSVHFQ